MVKNALREKQEKNLKSDVKDVLLYQKIINGKTYGTFDKTRILGVVAAGKGAENYLPYTIPKIIKQISELGMGADVIIGLNNGLECNSVITRFSFLPNVQVIHLYTEEKRSSTLPAQVFENLKCESEPYYLSSNDLQPSKNRIFVIHQREGAFSCGKIRILGDIYNLLLQSINGGWIPPSILVAFDAESQFLVDKADLTPELESNGLTLIIR